MSSPNANREFNPTKRAFGLALVAVLGFGLSGCLRPLYGPTATGQNLQDALAAIDVLPIRGAVAQQRLGHYLRSELVFDLDGAGREEQKRYKLEISVVERLNTPIVDTATGRADSATLIAEADYRLTSLDGSRLIASGKALGDATYDRNSQRFATLRAARDAEIRLAKLLAEQIKTRLAVALKADPVAL